MIITDEGQKMSSGQQRAHTVSVTAALRVTETEAVGRIDKKNYVNPVTSVMEG